ncbi:hypothetical protein B0J17DRAFT_572250 [Rhizoctonia solani]|nr:hypothetical protein B0J17DRAFT_572250 [Rhizoctonia solani]
MFGPYRTLPTRKRQTKAAKAAECKTLIKAALDIVFGQNGKERGSISDASRQTGIPRTTIWNQKNGQQEQHIAHIKEQLLSPEEEAEIVLWCEEMEHQFLPVCLIHVIVCAGAILSN